MGATFVRVPTRIWSDPAFTSLTWQQQHAWFVELLQRNTRRRPHGVTPAQRAAVYAADGHACRHCGTGDNLSIDHVMPRSLGGTDATENLQTLCRSCNSRKGAKLP